MKLFVLTHCAAEQNYTPEVFVNEEAAIEEMKNIFQYCISEGEFVVSKELYKTSAEVIYTDDTYDRLDIFEVELREE